jgi:hypothetical protein
MHKRLQVTCPCRRRNSPLPFPWITSVCSSAWMRLVTTASTSSLVPGSSTRSLNASSFQVTSSMLPTSRRTASSQYNLHLRVLWNRVILTPFMFLHVEARDRRGKTHEEIISEIRIILGHPLGVKLVTLRGKAPRFRSRRMHVLVRRHVDHESRVGLVRQSMTDSRVKRVEDIQTVLLRPSSSVFLRHT